MKSLALLITMASLCGTCPGFSQSFARGRDVFTGMGDDQVSKPFTMSGPFVLSWSLIDVPPSKADERKFRTPYSDRNPAWISIRVMDAKTGARVDWESKTGMTGTMVVSKGGTFCLDVTSYDNVKWVILAQEGKLLRTERGESIVPVTMEEKRRSEGRQETVPVRETTTASPATAPAPAPAPSSPSPVETRSTWDGLGLPPGMRKK